jgi:lipopolysaccharide transport system ATP-binding protein
MLFALNAEFINNAEIGIRVTDQKERVVFTSQSKVNAFERTADYLYKVTCTIPKNFLVPNSNKINIALHIPNKILFSVKEEAVSFNIEETGTDFHQYNGNDYGCVFVNCEWK